MPLPVTSGISEIDIIENLAKESREEEEQRYSTCQAASAQHEGWKSGTSLLQGRSTRMITRASAAGAF